MHAYVFFKAGTFVINVSIFIFIIIIMKQSRFFQKVSFSLILPFVSFIVLTPELFFSENQKVQDQIFFLWHANYLSEIMMIFSFIKDNVLRKISGSQPPNSKEEEILSL